jgi:type I restriction enzyme, S subunit
MANEWQEVQLGGVADLITGYPFKSQNYTDDISAARLIGGDNIAQGCLRWENVRRWPVELTDGLDAYWLKRGDVVLAMDRPWIEAGLKRAAIGEQDVPSLLVQRTARIRGSDELDNGFLRYVIGSQAFTQYILSVQTGTAVPHISPTQIRAYSFLLPPIEKQRAIAHILGALDDKIELNRKQNETLETMARVLFKAWFVDFEPVRAKIEGRWQRGQSLPGLPAHLYDLFPDRLVESELGEIPEGWRMGSLGEVAAHPRRSVQPSEIKDETPYIALEHMPKRCIALTEWGAANGLESNKYEFKQGEILFGKLRPYFHKVGVAPVDGVCSTDIVVIASRLPIWFGFVLTHASSDAFVEYTNAGSTGTKMPRTSWTEMARYAVVLPHEDVAAAFNQHIQAASEEISAKIHESKYLAQLRDTLLPKLISGELRVPEAERFVGLAAA